jgi:parallel beta-helix repeat protein
VCIAGDLAPGRPPTVRRQVRGVTVRGLTISRFPSTGLLTIGARDTRVDRTDIAGGTSYGILLANSSSTVITGSKVHGGASAGIYIGDSPESDSTVVGNDVYDNGFFGVYIRNAAGGKIIGNTIRDNCIGVGLLPTLPAQDTVADWSVTANRIHDNNRICPFAEPPFTGIGILMSGTARTRVTANSITGNALPAGSPPNQGGGILLLTGAIFGGPENMVDSQVRGNVLRDNEPFDIVFADQGLRNQVSGNVCRTSSPGGLCVGRP